jgi:ubiquinone/menaquinone biosynthesis C-methylase UbiE
MESLRFFEQCPSGPSRRELDCSCDTTVLDAKAGYDLGADYYDDWRWQKIWGKIERPFVDGVLASLSPKRLSPPLILDVGVGTGSYLQHVHSKFGFKKCYGVDISRRMLAVAKSKLRSPMILETGDARKLRFPDATFDVVLLCRVGSHIDDIHSVATEIHRVLRRGGLFVVTDVDPRHPYKTTRIPFGCGKISIETYKHSVEDWTRVAVQSGLYVRNTVRIWSTDIRRKLPSDLPSSLLHSNHPVSFVISALKFDC